MSSRMIFGLAFGAANVLVALYLGALQEEEDKDKEKEEEENESKKGFEITRPGEMNFFGEIIPNPFPWAVQEKKNARSNKNDQPNSSQEYRPSQILADIVQQKEEVLPSQVIQEVQETEEVVETIKPLVPKQLQLILVQSFVPCIVRVSKTPNLIKDYCSSVLLIGDQVFEPNRTIRWKEWNKWKRKIALQNFAF